MLEFNPLPPTTMHVDINSCFATIEQQANPRLRGKPTVVAAYAEDHGCILAASREAKAIGIGTGMRVKEAKARCPYVTVLPPDPDKYRFVNHQLKAILGSYTPNLSVESIDEMVLDLAGTPRLSTELRSMNYGNTQGISAQSIIHTSSFMIQQTEQAMKNIGLEIKKRIKSEIGEWITVSIGIAPNRYLAKIASGLHKPDGMDLLTRDTIVRVFSEMRLEDLCGIKTGNATRLRKAGIYTPYALLHADAPTLHKAFKSIVGRQWWQRLHGYEDGVRYSSFGTGVSFAQGCSESKQKSFGHSHALGTPLTPSDPELWQVLSQLVVKMGNRLRTSGYMARGITIALQYGSYRDYWHAQELLSQPIYASNDFFFHAKTILQSAPDLPVRNLAVSCYRLSKDLYTQQSLLESDTKKECVTQCIDTLSAKYGDFTVTPARMLQAKQKVLDRISFGKV